jgi:regulator of RNase E activity RraA
LTALFAISGTPHGPDRLCAVQVSADAVGHYATVAKNVPVECAGVTVRPGDIIVADEDGVVVVPQEHAAWVLKESQSIDDRERGMYPFMRQFKSLQQAIAKFNRI